MAASLQALDDTRARFGAPPPRCCQAQHLGAGAALQALDGTRARFGAPSLDAVRRSTWQPRGSFLLAGAALQALDGTRARFGAPSLDAARRTRGSFLLAGAALQALDGTRARFGAPPVSAGRGSTSGSGRYPSAFRGPPPLMLPGAALGSLAARFCWQGQHFRLWTVPEPPLMQHLGASRLVCAGRGSTSGSGRYPSAFRGPPPSMLPGAALGSLAARFCWQGQHFTPLMLPGAALGLAPPPP